MTRPLRVCVVAACPVPYPRGTPIRITRMSEAVAALGHEVHLVTYPMGAGALDPAIHLHRVSGVPGIAVTRPGPTLGKLMVLDPLLALRLRRVRRDHEFDVVHAHHYEGLLVSAASRPRGIPLILDAHTVLETELPSYAAWIPKGPKRRWGAFLDRRLPRLAEHVVAVSHPLRDHLVSVDAVPADRITVIGNGVELHRFPPFPPPPEPDPDGGILVYAGNLAPYQGIPHLLSALGTVVERRPAARLRIITESPFAPFERLAAELGVRGSVDVRAASLEELPGELRQAHVMVNPRPVCDGVPQKNLNYMAASRPTVAFAGSIHPGVDGETGIAVRPVSGAALGQAILRILDSHAEGARMGASARATLRREHTWEAKARRVVSLYEELRGSSE